MKKDKTVELSLNVDESDRNKIPSILKKISKRNNINITDDQIRDFVNTPFEEFQPSIKNSIKIDIPKCQKAILKIVYELGCYWIGDSYFNDPIAITLRDAIFNNNSLRELARNKNLRGNIEFASENSMFPFLNNNRASHIAFSNKRNDIICCYIRIFMSFEGIILLSRNASLYPDFEDKFIEINVEEKTLHETSFLGEVCDCIKKANK